MKREEINEQSKNEVKDLLDGYVVEPLTVDVRESVGKMKDETIDKLEENKSEIKANARLVVNEGINSLKRELDETEEQIVNEINDHLRDITDALIGDCTNTIKKEVPDVTTTIKNIILDSTRIVQSDITKKQKILGDSIKSSEKFASDNFTDIKNQIITLSVTEDTGLKNTQQLITDKMKQLCDMAENTSATIEKNINELEENLNADYNLTSDKIKNVDQKIETLFESTTAMLTEYNSNVNLIMDEFKMEIMEYTQKKYKILMNVSVSLGILNFLGVITAIILHFMF